MNGDAEDGSGLRLTDLVEDWDAFELPLGLEAVKDTLVCLGMFDKSWIFGAGTEEVEA